MEKKKFSQSILQHSAQAENIKNIFFFEVQGSVKQ